VNARDARRDGSCVFGGAGCEIIRRRTLADATPHNCMKRQRELSCVV
jgi:hypothetical protein